MIPEVLEKLKKEVFILNQLLQEPQPAEVSWYLYVVEKWHEIIKLYDPRLEKLRVKLLEEIIDRQFKTL